MTFGLFHLQTPDVGAGSGPPGGSCIVHLMRDELRIKQDTVSCGQVGNFCYYGEVAMSLVVKNSGN
jgi:hypothetical protein